MSVGNSGVWDSYLAIGNTITINDMASAGSSVFAMSAEASSFTITDNTLDIQGTGSGITNGSITDGCSGYVARNKIYLHTTDSSYGIFLGNDSPSDSYNNKVDAIVENNTIYGPGYYGLGESTLHTIGCGHCKSIILRYNKLFGGGYGAIIKSFSTFSSGDEEIYGNEIINTEGNAAATLAGPSGARIYNNTVYNDADHAGDDVFLSISYNASVGATHPGKYAVNSTIKNNVIYGSGSGSLLGVFASAEVGNSVDYNLFYINNYNPTGAYFYVPGSVPITFANWQSATWYSYDQNSFFSDPSFVSDSNNRSLNYLSSAIDAGTSIVDSGYTIDINGNPIYGTPDIGAYEYQPPHTMGTNEVNIGSGTARIYDDGKFRDIGSTSSAYADITITPTGSTFPVSVGSTEPRDAWMDLSINTWETSGDYSKEWVETSTTLGSTDTLHTIGDLESNKYYNITLDSGTSYLEGDDCDIIGSDFVCLSNGSGEIEFTYTGGYSTHTFNIEEGDNTAPTTTASPAGGSFASTQSVILTCDDNSGSGCDKIYYTTDGNNPTTGSTQYSAPISISSTTTLKFFAQDLNGNSESVNTETYTISTENNSQGYQTYQSLKKDYNNSSSKTKYTEIKNYKKYNITTYLKYKIIYEQYKKLSSKELKKLPLTIQQQFKAYKKYHGYKKYKEYKKRYD